MSFVPMVRGARFRRHTHHAHQLAWACVGVVSVTAGETTWILPPTRALWIPANVPHEVLAANGATMASTYLRPERAITVTWTEPTPVKVTPLIRELVHCLGDDTLDASRRGRVEDVLVDLLEPAAVNTIDVRLPIDDRALDVALGLISNPADNASVNEWGSRVGASGRTLARAFVADTGVSFGRWRTMARIQAALQGLAEGDSVGTVAFAVGYSTPSAFVAAFRRETGTTPGTYVRPT